MEGFNHVDPGGPPLVVPLSGSVTMIKVSVGPVDNNAYLLAEPRQWQPAPLMQPTMMIDF